MFGRLGAESVKAKFAEVRTIGIDVRESEHNRVALLELRASMVCRKVGVLGKWVCVRLLFDRGIYIYLPLNATKLGLSSFQVAASGQRSLAGVRSDSNRLPQWSCFVRGSLSPGYIQYPDAACV